MADLNELRAERLRQQIRLANARENARLAKEEGKERLKSRSEGKKKFLVRKRLTTLPVATERGRRRFRAATAGTGGLLRAFGVPVSSSVSRANVGTSQQVKRYAHAGRPTGSYKYGMPIQEYKRMLAQQKALRSIKEGKEIQEMQRKGYSPEQIQQVRMQRIAQEQAEQNTISNSGIEEQRLRKQIEMQQVSPHTQMMLDRIRSIQTKGARDNANMQRIVRERMLVARESELLKAKNLFGPESNTMDIFNKNDNILNAENIFSEMNPNAKKIIKTGRLSILDTKNAGNDLRFI